MPCEDGSHLTRPALTKRSSMFPTKQFPDRRAPQSHCCESISYPDKEKALFTLFLMCSSCAGKAISFMTWPTPALCSPISTGKSKGRAQSEKNVGQPSHENQGNGKEQVPQTLNKNFPPYSHSILQTWIKKKKNCFVHIQDHLLLKQILE